MDAKKSQTPGGDRAARVAALCSLLEALRRDVVVTVSTPEGEELASWELAAHGKAEPARDGPGREPTETPATRQEANRRDPKGLWDVRRCLADADPARLTQKQILDALKLDGLEWSDRQVARWLAALVERGEVDNRKNDGDRGTGYGFCYG